MPETKKTVSYQNNKKDSYLSAASGDWLEENFSDQPDLAIAPLAQTYQQLSIQHQLQGTHPAPAPEPTAADSAPTSDHSHQAKSWIEQYRKYGYSQAALNPLENSHAYAHTSQLDPKHFGLDDTTLIATAGLLPQATATVAAIQEKLKELYHGPIGIEVDHIRNQSEAQWLTEQFEKPLAMDEALRMRIFTKLLYAELLERHLHNNFVGQKRFSLEGTETLIPLLDLLIQQSNAEGVEEFLIGMAHRGRLNVLINIMGKTPAQLFDEFAGKFESVGVNGDVKYHLGFSSTLNLAGGTTHLVLAFNPSHLEIINPVVLGSARARQDRFDKNQAWKVLPITIHGDASFSGQGVVMESLNMSQTRGFNTGGTIHIVVNNQIGFTIDHPQDARSTIYASDPARFIDAPIIHFNADEPEAAYKAATIALAYRQKFGKDIVIDMIGYRRHGHNEADDPTITQPLMYQEIKKRPTVVGLYHKQLTENNIFDDATLTQTKKTCKEIIEKGQCTVEGVEYVTDKNSPRLVTWLPFINPDNALLFQPFKNSVPIEKLTEMGISFATLPRDFATHPQLQKLFKNRLKMADGDLPCDWGFAENLAYATLLEEGYGIRLTGQDVKRGTFAHRHTVLHDQKTNYEHYCLQQFVKPGKMLSIYDSLLSEEAVAAFEYGYATAEPNTLIIWEAQFGDFTNGAQVIIDQFISSGEVKWARSCGMVMLLPHGYEGQGPEHSSARIERFMQLCAQHNMQVVVPTTPAQIYHLLRRQLLRKVRKPLIVMSPKSLLRHPAAVSSLTELSKGYFQTIIDDTVAKEDITKIIFCSGKVYYQLVDMRKELDAKNTAIVRIEQLYPFPKIDYKNIIDSFPRFKEAVWCQEEPMNQGAWYNIRHRLNEHLEKKNTTIRYAGRGTSASPAVGLASLHKQEQQTLVEEAFNHTITLNDD